MREFVLPLLLGVWGSALAMAPYLLFGFLVAGLLSVVVRPEVVERHLGGSGPWPVIKAALCGVPLPLCSCGVIPVSASLKKHGASRGATLAFLISTPQTGVDSILVTLSMLGPVVAIFRPIAALVTGIAGGLLTNVLADEPRPAAPGAGAAHVHDGCQDECCAPGPCRSWLFRALHYGFVTLPRDIARPLAGGLLVAGLISVLVPDDFFAGAIGNGFLGMLIMMCIGIPMYVCATASVPIAAALVAKGVSPGAAIVFLVTGPATNAAAIATIWKMLGRRVTFIYLGVVAGAALLSGVLLNRMISTADVVAQCHGAQGMLPGWFSVACVAGLAAVLLAGLIEPAWFRRRGPSAALAQPAGSVELRVTGMTCSHCERTVARTALTCRGVTGAVANQRTGRLVLEGKDIDVAAVAAALEEIGYTAAATTADGDDATP